MARNNWTADEIGLLIDNFNRSKDDIAELLNTNGFDRTLEAIKTKKRDLRRKGGIEDVLELAEAVGEIELEAKKVESEGHFPDAKKREIYSEYKDMFTSLVAEAKEDVKARGGLEADSSPVSSDKESICIMISDWHIGKVVENDGIESYNTEIALRRIEELTKNVQRVISYIRGGTQVDEIVCLFLGDLIDGESVYNSHAHHIDSHVALQVKNAIRALWKMIITLAEIEGVEKVRVLCVRGNHGRSGAIGGHEDSNFDTIVHDGLEWSSILHGDARITVSSRYSQFNIAEVKGHRILMRHEAPAHADTSAAKARISGWLDLHAPIDAITYGHLHHPSISTYNDRYLFMNGSCVGGDDLSERMAVGNAPTQLLFGVTQKRIPSFIYPIVLED